MPRPDPPPKLPLVLILGGLQTLARPLALFLLSPPTSFSPKPLAAFVRIADRFSVNPASTYLDRPFRDLLSDSKDGRVEYQQINLSNVARHTEVFTPPEMWRGRAGTTRDAGDMGGRGVQAEAETERYRGFDIVFDLTGEMGFDKPEIVRPDCFHQRQRLQRCNSIDSPTSR